MSTIRVSKTDLHEEPFAFTAEESAFFETVTSEQLHAAALADPDNKPWTDEMFEDARHRRKQRLASRDQGVELRPALPSNSAGVWAVTDAGGRTVFIQATRVELADCKPSETLYEIVPIPTIGQL